MHTQFYSILGFKRSSSLSPNFNKLTKSRMGEPREGQSLGDHRGLPGNLPNPGVEPRFPALQADSLPSEPPGKPCAVDGRSVVSNSSRLHGL